ncbi:hypothetical protein [Streptomyces sp. NPDC055287]
MDEDAHESARLASRIVIGGGAHQVRANADDAPHRAHRGVQSTAHSLITQDGQRIQVGVAMALR